jgi:hypothetical protein
VHSIHAAIAEFADLAKNHYSRQSGPQQTGQPVDVV